MSDKGKDFLTSALPYSMDDIKWFDSAQIEYNGNITLDDMGIELNMKLNKKNLFKIDAYMSDKNMQVNYLNSQIMYLHLIQINYPEISDIWEDLMLLKHWV